MDREEVVLITGVSNYWGSRICRHLQVKPGFRVLGIDARITNDVCLIKNFIQADLRNPLIQNLIKSEDVSIVCHLDFLDNPTLNSGSVNSKILSTIKLLKACEQTNVHMIIFNSATAVYGAHSTNSAFIPEGNSLKGSKNIELFRDLIDSDTYIQTNTGRSQGLKAITLRFANIIGPTVDNYFTGYLNFRFIPIFWGFNPRIQVIHENDVENAIVHAITKRKSGIFNVAAEGILPLDKLIRMCGKLSIPISTRILKSARKIFFSNEYEQFIEYVIESDFLKYSCVADIYKMKNQLGFIPSYTADEAVNEFAAKRLFSREPDELHYNELDVEFLRDTIGFRKRVRENKSYSDNVTGNNYESC